MESKKRNLIFDVARGIAIFLVIWGHVVQQWSLGEVSEHFIVKFIYAFHMPLFALISGYFFYVSAKTHSFKTLLMQRVRKFFILICVWNTVHYLFSLLLYGVSTFTIEFLISGWLEEILEGYWFLWAILFYTIAVGFVIQKVRERYWILGFAFSMAVCLLTPCRWPIVTLAPFFWLGIMARKKAWFENLTYRNGFVWTMLFVGGTIFYFYGNAIGNAQLKVVLDSIISVFGKKESITLLVYEFGRLILYYFLGLTGSMTIIYLSKWLATNMLRVKISQKLIVLGTESLGIYILQRILVEQLCPALYLKVVDRWGIESIYLPINVLGGVISFLLTVLFIAVVYTCVVLLKKCKLKVII